MHKQMNSHDQAINLRGMYAMFLHKSQPKDADEVPFHVIQINVMSAKLCQLELYFTKAI